MRTAFSPSNSLFLPIVLSCAMVPGFGGATLASQPSGRAVAAHSHRLRRDVKVQSRAAAFERNTGAFDASVRFVRRGRNMDTFVQSDGLTIKTRGERRGASSISLRFAGASPGASVAGVGRPMGKANYFIGSDPSRWRTNVDCYQSVMCRGLYEGIDAVYYDATGDLEYDLVVAPGGDVDAIRLEIEGEHSARIDASTGRLAVPTASGEVVQTEPTVYQETAHGRRIIPSRYVELGGAIGIEVAEYDRSRTLTIDPVLRFSTYVGGDEGEVYNAVAVDAFGNAYAAGNSFSMNFPTTPGAFQTDQPDDDVVVTKFGPAGGMPIFSTYIGGDLGDFCSSVAVDLAGNVYLAGTTISTNFPTMNQAQTDQAGADAVLVKLNPSGSALLYSTYLGGSADDLGRGVAATSGGAAFLVGTTLSSNFPTSASAYQGSLVSAVATVFVTRIDTTGAGPSTIVYSTYLGDGGDGTAIATDGLGRAYVCGRSDGTAFPTTIGAFQGNQPDVDGFVSKIDTGLSGVPSLVYSTYLGGSGVDSARSIALGSDGTAYVTGATTSNNFPTTATGFQPTQPTPGPSSRDGYFVRLNAAATGITYGTYLGGSDDDQAQAISIDSVGGVYVCGLTLSTNFPTTSGATGDLSGTDVFASRFDVTRSGAASLVASTYYGGDATEIGFGIAANNSGEATIVGYTESTDLPLKNSFQPDQIAIDAFIARLSLDNGATGSDTVAVYSAATGSFFLKNSNAPGPGDVVFNFGAGGTLVPLAGDWDGDGTTTIGVYAPASGSFFLKNTNAPGGADLVFSFGAGGAGLVPLTGDWNGDGTDTIGVYQPATGAFFLRNSNSNGVADLAFGYGPGGPGFIAVTGDWNGDAIDTPGLYDPATGNFFLRNANAGGFADLVFSFGAGGALPVVGDFDNDGMDTIGIYVPASSTWFLRDENAGGPADLAFSYGPPSLTPLVGDWNGS